LASIPERVKGVLQETNPYPAIKIERQRKGVRGGKTAGTRMAKKAYPPQTQMRKRNQGTSSESLTSKEGDTDRGKRAGCRNRGGGGIFTKAQCRGGYWGVY